MAKEKPAAIKVVFNRKGKLTDIGMHKSFHIDERLNTYPEFYRGPADAAEFNVEENQQNECYVLAKLLFELKGVQAVGVNGYIVDVFVTLACSWDPIQARVVEIIKEYAQGERVKNLEDGKEKE